MILFVEGNCRINTQQIYLMKTDKGVSSGYSKMCLTFTHLNFTKKKKKSPVSQLVF